MCFMTVAKYLGQDTLLRKGIMCCTVLVVWSFIGTRKDGLKCAYLWMWAPGASFHLIQCHTCAWQQATYLGKIKREGGAGRRTDCISVPAWDICLVAGVIKD